MARGKDKKKRKRKTWLGTAAKGALAGAVIAPLLFRAGGAVVSDKYGRLLKNPSLNKAWEAFRYGGGTTNREMIGSAALGGLTGAGLAGIYGLDKYGINGKAEQERKAKKRYNRNKKILKRAGINI